MADQREEFTVKDITDMIVRVSTAEKASSVRGKTYWDKQYAHMLCGRRHSGEAMRKKWRELVSSGQIMWWTARDDLTIEMVAEALVKNAPKRPQDFNVNNDEELVRELRRSPRVNVSANGRN